MKIAEQKNFRDSKKPSKKIIVLVILLAVLLISALIFLAQTKNIFWKSRNTDEGKTGKYVLSGLVIGDKLITENLKGEAKGNE